VPTVSAALTPPPDPKALVREYLDTLNRDLANFKLVDAPCAGGDTPCKAAIEADAAVARKAHDDIGALYAEPAAAQGPIEDIRQGLYFAPNVAAGYDAYSRSDDVSFMDSVVRQVARDMARLRTMA